MQFSLFSLVLILAHYTWNFVILSVKGLMHIVWQLPKLENSKAYHGHSWIISQQNHFLMRSISAAWSFWSCYEARLTSSMHTELIDGKASLMSKPHAQNWKSRLRHSSVNWLHLSLVNSSNPLVPGPSVERSTGAGRSLVHWEALLDVIWVWQPVLLVKFKLSLFSPDMSFSKWECCR